MKKTSLTLALLVMLCGLSCRRSVPPRTSMTKTHAAGAHAHRAHEHDSDHFSSPEDYLDEWNNPERDAWQKPAEILAALKLPQGATVADLGAGTGYLLPTLSQAVGAHGRVLALDIEPAMLRFLNGAKARNGWTNVEVRQAAPNDPGLAPASIDALVTLNVWHHLESRAAYAARLREALKPNGTILIVDFLKEPTDGFGPPLSMRLSAEEVLAELAAAGFEAEIVSETMPRHYMVRGKRP